MLLVTVGVHVLPLTVGLVQIVFFRQQDGMQPDRETDDILEKEWDRNWKRKLY